MQQEIVPAKAEPSGRTTRDAATVTSKREAVCGLPLRADWLVWVVPVDDVEQAGEIARAGAPRGELVTRDVERLFEEDDRWVSLHPTDGVAAIRRLIEEADRVAERRAPTLVFVERGSRAHALGVALAGERG